MLVLLSAIGVGVALGFLAGCKWTQATINWLIRKGVVDIFYHGQRVDQFEW